METPRLVGVGVHTDRGKYGAQMRKGQVRGKLGRNIMALCIMSKCCRSWVVEREVGAGTSFLGDESWDGTVWHYA